MTMCCNLSLQVWRGVSSSWAMGGRGEEGSHSEEYRARRQRNNEAVRKTRMIKKQKEQETQAAVMSLREENRRLEQQLEHLTSQKDVLKKIYEQS